MQTAIFSDPTAENSKPLAKRLKLDLGKLPRRNAFIGNPEELVDFKVWDEAEWGEPKLLAECEVERHKR